MPRYPYSLALVVMVSCRPAATPPPPVAAPTTTVHHDVPRVPAIAPPWTLVVGDGSGNVYRCEHVEGGTPQLEYRPVTPETSSSGDYSGGAPRQGPLTPEQVEELWALVEALVGDRSGHVEDRGKGTVAVDANGPTEGSVILSGKAGGPLVELLATLPTPSP